MLSNRSGGSNCVRKAFVLKMAIRQRDVGEKKCKKTYTFCLVGRETSHAQALDKNPETFWEAVFGVVAGSAGRAQNGSFWGVLRPPAADPG